MEEANVSERHSDAVLVAGINNMIVTDTTACFCYVFNTTLMSSLNIVAEGKKASLPNDTPFVSGQSKPFSPRGSMAQAFL